MKQRRADRMPRLLGVAGDPVDHSLSPRFQNAALRRLGLPYIYRTFRCPDGAALRRLVELAPVLDLHGLNITTPLKEAAADLVLRAGTADEEVAWSRSVNTLLTGNVLRGASTDGTGGLAALRELGAERRRPLIVLGFGATARSLVWHLLRDRRRRIAILTRRPAAARRRLRRLPFTPAADLTVAHPGRWKGEAHAWGTLVSTWPPRAWSPETAAVVAPHLEGGAVVIDLNYGAGRERLFRWARRGGYVARDGRLFLLHQGIGSFRLWTRRRPPVDVMRAALGL
ncbi:MAG: hypothetical protein GF355_03290 [Candidatus Eisenbacteria bacterium]|nr:hypothetical protein [Candidatus Eisenbacteria bacterium]